MDAVVVSVVVIEVLVLVGLISFVGASKAAVEATDVVAIDFTFMLDRPIFLDKVVLLLRTLAFPVGTFLADFVAALVLVVVVRKPGLIVWEAGFLLVDFFTTEDNTFESTVELGLFVFAVDTLVVTIVAAEIVVLISLVGAKYAVDSKPKATVEGASFVVAIGGVVIVVVVLVLVFISLLGAKDATEEAFGVAE
ncbi:hypothetical protein NQD34_015715 [Periophthalmus magnuspinnatus]|nr:hypothetical protein NQD34_015715 [Periophthalmus magnuspinnatus]